MAAMLEAGISQALWVSKGEGDLAKFRFSLPPSLSLSHTHPFTSASLRKKITQKGGGGGGGAVSETIRHNGGMIVSGAADSSSFSLLKVCVQGTFLQVPEPLCSVS